MLQVAGLAPRLLNDSTELVEKFVLSKINDDGGFHDRVGDSDLYYSVFGIGYCSGQLLNNTAEDERPLFLTGFHWVVLGVSLLAVFLGVWQGHGG